MDVVALINGKELVQHNEVEQCPEMISDAVSDQSVNIHS